MIIKVKNGQLKDIIAAFNDFSSNRMPYSISVRLHNARGKFEKAIMHRQSLRDALVAPYIKEGKEGIEPGEEGYEELTSKLNELWNEEIEIDFGDPIQEEKIAALGDKVAVMGSSIDMLHFIGFLTNGDSPNA